MELQTSDGQEAEFEFVGSSTSEAVVQAVAEAAGTDPTELPPLYDQVDPDALEKLFRNPSNGVVAFDYHGYTVVVRSDGTVLLK
ncbi:HalOD1 output domain-containing protein [Haloarcula sp. GH36]|uniref:HalOD1 output domain-containing protein n=1 Tax=Haloarcula montana TaxID=3111776 RepID=UPI002D775879|nr:HalOD1 output domain-containing protein [Haloarcula sp. GH36]